MSTCWPGTPALFSACCQSSRPPPVWAENTSYACHGTSCHSHTPCSSHTRRGPRSNGNEAVLRMSPSARLPISQSALFFLRFPPSPIFVLYSLHSLFVYAPTSVILLLQLIVPEKAVECFYFSLSNPLQNLITHWKLKSLHLSRKSHSNALLNRDSGCSRLHWPGLSLHPTTRGFQSQREPHLSTASASGASRQAV